MRVTSRSWRQPLAREPFGESGSALALVPAGFLVFVILAAIAVDSAVALLGQQQLADTLSAAASDASAAALSSPAFYARGQVLLDPVRVGQVVCESVAAQSDRDLHDLHLRVAVAGPALRLAGTASVDAVFGRALPGLSRYGVSADVGAVASGGGSLPLPPRSALVPLNC